MHSHTHALLAVSTKPSQWYNYKLWPVTLPLQHKAAPPWPFLSPSLPLSLFRSRAPFPLGRGLFLNSHISFRFCCSFPLSLLQSWTLVVLLEQHQRLLSLPSPNLPLFLSPAFEGTPSCHPPGFNLKCWGTERVQNRRGRLGTTGIPLTPYNSSLQGKPSPEGLVHLKSELWGFM